ncbi:MAG: sulfatase-like hydrolase/transferase [Pseudomonadales bacterium]|nr:sulfatase-like hydrolase/transferase [Pseudomonadales bacterium]PCJ62263.1 MAG: sulfatase [Planctomycetota bacterium]
MSKNSNAKNRPNILWVSFEDSNPFYGCYGDQVARTPIVDQLAKDGCIWPNAFAPSGVCSPSRSAVITGMYPTSIGTHHMRTTHNNDNCRELPTPYDAKLPHYVKCFTEYFRASGYYCTNNHKTDYQFESPVTAWDELGKEAHWRNRPNTEQPFFAVFNPMLTHESGMWPENKWCENNFNPDDMVLPPYFPDTKKVRESMTQMYANIEWADQQLGNLLKELDEDGLAENTIVVHWSDHGPMPRGKRWPYDSGIHIPMIIRYPENVKPDSINEDLISSVDLGPTMMSLAGLEIPQYMQGQAFLGNEKEDAREYIFAHRDRHDESYDMVRAVRDKKFKYMRHYDLHSPYLPFTPYCNRHPIVQEMHRLYFSDELNDVQKLMFEKKPSEELYDIVEDPHEVNNLAKDSKYKIEIKRLRKALDQWMFDIGDLGKITEEEMVRNWYPDGKQPQTSVVKFFPLDKNKLESELTPMGGEFSSPTRVQLVCMTQGASIAYTFENGENIKWQLYHEPLMLEKGSYRIRTKSIRIGFAESEETSAEFIVK